MNRPKFLGALASALATLGFGSIPVRASVAPLPLGECARFPGFALKAFEIDNEVYLAYSAQALLDEGPDWAESLDEIHELGPDDVRSNAGMYYSNAPDDEIAAAREAEEACDGRCASRGVPDHEAGGHDCFVVRDRIAEMTRAIDAGVFGRSHEQCYAPYRPDYKPWHPARAGMVDQLWTEYN